MARFGSGVDFPGFSEGLVWCLSTSPKTGCGWQCPLLMCYWVGSSRCVFLGTGHCVLISVAIGLERKT